MSEEGEDLSRERDESKEEEAEEEEDHQGGQEERTRPVPALVEGYLDKLKHKPSSISSWNRRFFKVDPSSESLLYYKSEKATAPLKVFKLKNILKVQSVDNYSFQIVFKGSNEMVLFLRAASDAEKMRWVHHLSLFVRELTSYTNWLCLSNHVAEPVIKPLQGYLSKLKRTPTSMSSSWNKRYFRINVEDKTLEYFNKEPSKGATHFSDRRIIELAQIVEVRVVDPWTFQLEVQTEFSPEKAKRVASALLGTGGMTYYCLQAKTPGEQNEWRSVIENYIAELSKYKSILRLREKAADYRRSVTFNAMEVELEKLINNSAEHNV